MFADIIPFVRLPRSQSTFTYAIPNVMTAHEGAIVEIHFRKKRIYGCVLRVHDTTPVAYVPKPIHAVLPYPQLTAQYRALLHDVAVATCTSPSLIYRDVIPIPPRKVSPAHNERRPTQQSLYAQKATGASTLFCAGSERALHAALANEMHVATQRKARLLILFPTHEKMERCIDALPHKKKIVVFHAQLGKRAYWDAWQHIEDGPAIVFGTRSAVFAPGIWDTIILAHEECATFTQEDQNPRYSAHAIAAYRQQQEGTNILFIAYGARVTTWNEVSKRKVDSTSSTIRLLDMRGGRHIGGIFHDENIRTITRSLDVKQHVTLVIARGGYAGSVLCKDCGFVLVCPVCNRPSRFQAQRLFCTVCNATRALPNSCPACHGAFFDFQGIGAERLEHMAHHIFGDRARAFITITTNPDTISAHTQCVIVVSSEALLHHPDFRAAERTYQWLAHITAKATDANATLIAQSWTPEHPVFSALVQRKPELFYTRELAERRSLHYPPFVRSALALWKSRTQHGQTRATPPGLSDTIIARAEKAGILLSEPYSRRDPTKGVIQNVIYLRHPIDRDERAFTDFLLLIPEPWIIAREPEGIF